MVKRLSASLVIDSGLVVNSYNFKTHLPVGKLNFTLQRLQDLEIDDVVILNATHSEDPVSDFRNILSFIENWHISTPLSFGGGIVNVNQAIEIVKLGAERVVLSTNSLVNSQTFSEICEYLGDQAVILHLPLEFLYENISIRSVTSPSLKSVIDLIPDNWGGEIMFSFVANDGAKSPNWENIGEAIKESVHQKSLILAGGFASAVDISQGLALKGVSAIAVGNYLHRVENSVLELKRSIDATINLRRVS